MLALLLYTLEKFWMGIGMLDSGAVRFVIHQLVIIVEWSLHPKIGVVYPLFLPKVIFFVLICYVLSMVH